MFKEIFSVICLTILAAGPLIGAKTLLVVNKDSKSLSFIDDSSFKEVLELKIGHYPEDTPHEVATNLRGTLALVSHYGQVQYNALALAHDNTKHPGNFLSLIDVAHGSVLKRIELPPASSPHGIVFISDTKALVTLEGIQSLLLINFSNETQAALSYYPIPGRGAHMITLDPQKNFAYVANKASGSVVKFDLQHMKAVREQVIGTHAEGIISSADGLQIFVTDRLKNSLTILKSDNLEILAQQATENGPIRMAFFDDQKQLAITNLLSGTVQTMNMSTQEMTSGLKASSFFSADTALPGAGLFGLLPLPISIVVRDDEETAYVSNAYAGNISLINLKTGKILKTITAGREPDGMALSNVGMSAHDMLVTTLSEQKRLSCAKKIDGLCADEEDFKKRYSTQAYAIINAHYSAVWSALINLEDYQSWNTFMPTIHSNLHVGDPVTFEVKLGDNFSFHETLEVLIRDEEKSLCWGSSPLGSLMQTKRCKHLIPLSDNRTLYFTTEKIKGCVGESIMTIMKKSITDGIELEALELKEWVEK
jgi:DNA-binding beta-propeller fold protein YncE